MILSGGSINKIDDAQIGHLIAEWEEGRYLWRISRRSHAAFHIHMNRATTKLFNFWIAIENIIFIAINVYRGCIWQIYYKKDTNRNRNYESQLNWLQFFCRKKWNDDAPIYSTIEMSLIHYQHLSFDWNLLEDKHAIQCLSHHLNGVISM